MSDEKKLECFRCKTEKVGWHGLYQVLWCYQCKKPARENARPARVRIRDEGGFCDCGKHYSECTCGSRSGGPSRRPPIPKGYDEEQFYK